MKFSLSLAALLMGVSLSVAAQPAHSPVADTQTAADAQTTPKARTAPQAQAAAGAQDAAPTVAATETTSNESPVPADAADAASALPPEKVAAVTKAFESRFPGIHVDGVRMTPMPGIYEVQVGMDLLYTDASVDYVLQGSLIDAKAKRDLTAARLESLQQVAFDTLPLKDAIRIVKGDGSRKLATFEDPNCPYCKQLHHTLASVDNVTVYVFLFPILAPDSATKSRDIWCAADPAKAWTDWMVDGKAPATADCKTPLQANLALGRKLNVQGTPALFFGNGARVNGALPLASLKEKLDAEGKG
jgi:thiol:disulfide interchange protein DsbC